jgi:mono/diheme cytochrome c family protein
MARVGRATAALAALIVTAFTFGVHAQGRAVPAPGAAPTPVPSHSSAGTAESPGALVKQYCVTCHNDRTKTGGL